MIKSLSVKVTFFLDSLGSGLQMIKSVLFPLNYERFQKRRFQRHQDIVPLTVQGVLVLLVEARYMWPQNIYSYTAFSVPRVLENYFHFFSFKTLFLTCFRLILSINIQKMNQTIALNVAKYTNKTMTTWSIFDYYRSHFSGSFPFFSTCK